MAEKKDATDDKLDTKDGSIPNCGHPECKEDHDYFEECNKAQLRIIKLLHDDGIKPTNPNIDAIVKVAIRTMVDNMSDKMPPGAMMLYLTEVLANAVIDRKEKAKSNGH